MSRMAILAARRVLPPDLITPAKASRPFIKDSGPLATPPPDTDSLLDRRGLKLVPVPEPNLNRRASVLAKAMISSIESPTELMKHAEH